jgi:alginate O-acetyltransferase complex protein AlgI
MLFNSLDFLVFFPIVVMVYFALPFRFRWLFLLAASYYFYACWEPGYLLLIVASTLVDYIAGLGMGSTDNMRVRRRYLLMSLFCNFGLLFTFKYFNFFASNFEFLFDFYKLPRPVLRVLLPVGISFYTFQTLSYTIDVYRGERKPEKHLGYFALYVSFFPQLVAGPIERSTRLLPQFFVKHAFDYDRMRSGVLLMMVGFFKKLVIADRFSVYVNDVYNNPGKYHGMPVLAATYFFSFQIFCDFSGYSDIAIGAARVMGYDLMENFRRPYFAISISDFWRRWHISLSTWMRDYLYISMGGNRVSKLKWYRNLLLTFGLSGLWHGAGWTYIIWGTLHGVYLVTSIITLPVRTRLHELTRLTRFPRVHHLLKILITFHLVSVSWYLFRASSLSASRTLFMSTFQDLKLFDPAIFMPLNSVEVVVGVLAILVMESVHIFQARGSVESWLLRQSLPLRWGIYYAMFFAIVAFGKFSGQEFIYFQF